MAIANAQSDCGCRKMELREGGMREDTRELGDGRSERRPGKHWGGGM